MMHGKGKMKVLATNNKKAEHKQPKKEPTETKILFLR